MNVNLSWERLWIYYGIASKEIQEDILKEIDLDDFLPRLAVSVRGEVMKHAPEDVRQMIEKVVPLTKREESYRTELVRIFGRK